MWVIDAVAAAMPGDGDVRAARRRGARACEEHDRQPDIAENEADEAPRDRHEEAPETDTRQHQPVHRLEYAP